jgi:membrane-bound serine protease (ClpP class)
LRRLAIGLLVALAGLAMLDRSAAAQSDDSSDAATTRSVDVLQVSGLIDEIVVDSIRDAIASAAESGAQALILQINSDGTVVESGVVEQLLDDVAEAPIAVAVWVGPNGARFYGEAAQLLAVADITGMAPGTRVGHVGAPLSISGEVVEFAPAAQDRLQNGSVNLGEATTLGVFTDINDEGVPTIKSMVQVLDGREVNGITLETTDSVILDNGQGRNDTTSTVRFAKLSLVDQLFHTAASPPVAYLLLLTGLALIIFEFFTAGVGVAGVCGAACLILAASGLAVLPTRTWALIVILLSMVAFSVDVQVGIPRFWTGAGLVGTVVGSFFLFESLPGTSLRPSWIALFTGIAGIALTFVVGMPNMVRTRFATPTIGRDWMIGEEGMAITNIDPEGIVEVGAGRWRALTNRATPVRFGERVRVAAIDGVTLEIEPLEGAARDYRERRSKSGDIDVSEATGEGVSPDGSDD